MRIKKEPYQISVWRDVPLDKGVKGYIYDEQLVAVIGSDEMTSQNRALSPVFVKNMAQDFSLAFSLHYSYLDNDTGEMVENPFVELLQNETKVKIKFRGKWHDMLVKTIEKNKTERKIYYTCRSLAYTELSRNGYNILLSTEIENSIGTVQELAERVLEGSDYELDTTNPVNIQDRKEEVMYTTTLKAALNVKNLYTNVISTIPSGERVGVFYTDVTSLESGETRDDVQIVYPLIEKTGTISNPNLLPDRLLPTTISGYYDGAPIYRGGGTGGGFFMSGRNLVENSKTLVVEPSAATSNLSQQSFNKMLQEGSDGIPITISFDLFYASRGALYELYKDENLYKTDVERILRDTEFDTIITLDEVYKGRPVWQAVKKATGSPPVGFLSTSNWNGTLADGESISASIDLHSIGEIKGNKGRLTIYDIVNGQIIASQSASGADDWEQLSVTYTNTTGAEQTGLRVYFYPASGVGDTTKFSRPTVLKDNSGAKVWRPAMGDLLPRADWANEGIQAFTGGELYSSQAPKLEIHTNRGLSRMGIDAVEIDDVRTMGTGGVIQKRVSVTTLLKRNPNSSSVDTIFEFESTSGDTFRATNIKVEMGAAATPYSLNPKEGSTGYYTSLKLNPGESLTSTVYESNSSLSGTFTPVRRTYSSSGEGMVDIFYPSPAPYFSKPKIEKGATPTPWGYERNSPTNYVIPVLTVSETTDTWNFRQNNTTLVFSISKNSLVTSDYIAQKVILTQRTVYDKRLNQYVQVYNDGAVHGFTRFEYKASSALVDLLSNGEYFTQLTGWRTTSPTPLQIKYDTSGGPDQTRSYISANMSANSVLTNDTIRAAASALPEGTAPNEEWVVRLNYSRGTNPSSTRNGLAISLNGSTFSATPAATGTDSTGYPYQDYYIRPGAHSQQEILKGNVKLTMKAETAGTYWIGKAQVFPKKTVEGELLVPKDPEVGQTETVMVYYYYDPKSSYTDESDLRYLSKTEGPNKNYRPTYSENLEKIRTVEGGDSNRFNLLQKIAETFQCWLVIDIPHDYNGKITTDADGYQIKRIKIMETMGQVNPVGFVYGIDLKDSNRSYASETIVSKLIVLPNSNEYAQDGQAQIAAAPENYIGQNFIMDFSYYINQGMLHAGAINRDLYATSPQKGFFTQLRELTKAYDKLIPQKVKLEDDVLKMTADLDFFETSAAKARDERDNVLGSLLGYTGTKTLAAARQWSASKPGDFPSRSYIGSYDNLNKLYEAHHLNMDRIKRVLPARERELVSLDKEMKRLSDEIGVVNEDFNRRYTRFTQEGTWINEDHLDHSLYYLDALSVSREAAFPKVEYVFPVINVSGLDGFENRKFELGDITTAEDPDFFGYTYVNGIKTPKKEPVTISEIVYNLDSPMDDQIVVRNYRTNFEDLFQRIEATIQTVQNSAGPLQKVTNIINPDGTIKTSVLQNSLARNAALAYSAHNDSVVIDHMGITATDLDNSQRIVRVSSKGIFYTSDGGLNWSVGITADGIATSSIASGIIYTDKITIQQGGAETFRWDSTGLNAYRLDEYGIDYNTFVRFDQYGIYGIRDVESFELPIQDAEKTIWDTAHFALTWKGFNLKTSHNGEDGFVRISSGEDAASDIVVHYDGVDRVLLGRLGPQLYGLQVNNGQGEPVLTANSLGDVVIDNALYVTNEGNHLVGIGNLARQDARFGGSEYIQVQVGPEYATQFGDPVEPNVYEIIDGTPVRTKDTLYMSGKDYFFKKSPIISANSKFIVYDDGSFLARDGYFIGSGSFVGHVEAESGVFRGAVYAESGEFTGIVNAESGSFRGHVEAISGTIGSATIDENSLTILGGGFKILGVDGQGNPVDYFVYEDNKLTIAGDSTFSGKIEAASGHIGGLEILEDSLQVATETGVIFSLDSNGNLIANSGLLGGLILNNNGITSPDYVISDGATGFSLGSDGNLVAQNLTIGQNATISNYLKFGTDTNGATIYNPNANNNLFIESGDIRIYSDGTAHFGDITVDGNNSTIFTANAWSLTPNLASFHNISASGSLSTMVFEPATVQAAGGLMLFKMSAKPDSTTGTKLTLQNKDLLYFQIGDWILLEDADGNRDTRKITAKDATGITYGGTAIGSSPIRVVTNLGPVDSKKSGTEWMIGVNSTNTRFHNFLEPNAITFSSFEEMSDGTIDFHSKIVLGRLNQVPGFTGSSYGLYAESAYLTGTLTTKTENGSYAGVNTINAIPYVKDPSDTSGIVFWAGARDSTPLSIQDSPFQVTERGTLFANQGYFSDSMFVGATIKAASIEAATLIGTSTSPALKIYNTNNKDGRGGIAFVNDNGNGMGIDDYYTMFLDANGIDLLEGEIRVGSRTVVDGDRQVFGKSFFIGDTEVNGVLQADKDVLLLAGPGTLEIRRDLVDIRINAMVGSIFRATQEVTNINSFSTQFQQDVVFGSGDGAIMNFVRADGGYDVYVE